MSECRRGTEAPLPCAGCECTSTATISARRLTSIGGSRCCWFGPYYGHNLDALWDRLGKDVPRPVHLTWVSTQICRDSMGSATFDRIERVLRAAADEDAAIGQAESFTYELA